MTSRHIRFGGDEISLPPDLARGAVAWLEPSTPAPSAEARQIIAAALGRPRGAPRLSDLARGKRTAAILIPGKTRVACVAEMVAGLVGELHEAGLSDDGIEVFLATGTHEPHLEVDFEILLGREMASRLRCMAHDCGAAGGLTRLGETRFGTPVWMSRRVLAADVRILTGRIVPHYFAGFTGGRKALLPGVAGFETILANHRLSLDPASGIHREVAPGSLDANPVHLDMLEGAAMARPDFCLNTLLDVRERLVAAVAGDFRAAHDEGCAWARRWYALCPASAVDGLVTSAGGAPYDCNFMQALKAVMNVQDLVRPGGAVLWIAECAGGMHPGFLRWAEIRSDDDLEREVRSSYDLTGHNSVMLRRLLARARVALWSRLPPQDVRRLGLVPVPSLDEGLAWLRGSSPDGAAYAVVPHGNVSYVPPHTRAAYFGEPAAA